MKSSEVCLKILVQVCTTGKQKMDVEGIPGFLMTTISRKSLAFLDTADRFALGVATIFSGASAIAFLTIWVSKTFPPILVKSMLKRGL